MPSSYTSSLRLTLPVQGELAGSWGNTVNTGITQLVDNAVAGTASITMTAANYTLSNNNGATDEARSMFLTLGGTPGNSFNVICPAVSKLYFVTNNTGFAQTVKTASGSGISVPNGARMALRCDGTDVVEALNALGSITLNGGTANGVVYLNGSKVVTTGSALVFDGTNFSTTGTATATKLIPTGGSATGNGMYLPAANTLAWSNNGAETMRLDSSGNLGIGTNSPGARLETVASGSAIYFSGGDSAGARRLQFNATTTTNTGDTQNINALGSTGVLAFSTNSSERARITSGGDLLVGTTTSSGLVTAEASGAGSAIGFFQNTAATPTARGLTVSFSNATGTNTSSADVFQVRTAGAERATIRGNGGFANYQANDANLSDERLKTDIQPAASYLNKICAIPVKTFLYKDQTDTERNLGVIAQDVDAIAPELVDRTGFGDPPEGESPYLAIYQTDLQYALMKCVQELKAQNDELRARVAQLESKA